MTGEDIYFAGVGDVHGEMYEMLGLLKKWESRLSFVLQVGDFEPHRHEADLQTMDAPGKYRKLGSFAHFYNGSAVFPYPVWFIGGNHEPYGFLDRIANNTEIATNCYYLGRVGTVELAGLKIVGLSGIYKEHLFEKRPPIEEIDRHSNADYIGFTENEVLQGLEFQRADILLLHEWPRGLMTPDNRLDVIDPEMVGNEYARMLVDSLKPRLVLCGHMHRYFCHQIVWPDDTITRVCCLAHTRSGSNAVEIFRLSGNRSIESLRSLDER
ncbi:MAG: metallophosphoesterase [Cyanobacteria bacterium SBLK]|nr:metallophosphoesterase [Cyanobacteria bacterium SBLK]